MVKVLFVCLGNICRSTMAEGVFKSLVKKQNLENNIVADSAGTASYHIDSLPDHRTLQTLRNHSMDLYHKGRQISEKDLINFDYILAMDTQNLKDILKLLPNGSKLAHKVKLMRDFDEGFEGKSVPDPYYGTMDDFEEVYNQVNRAGKKLLNHIIEHDLQSKN